MNILNNFVFKNFKDLMDYLKSYSFAKFVETVVQDYMGCKNVKFIQEHPIVPKTDGEIVTYDPYPDNYLLAAKENKITLINAIACILGDIFHELLHVKYTICEIMQAIGSGNYNRKNFNKKYVPLMEYIVIRPLIKTNPQHRRIIMDLFNIIEDASIELRGKEDSKVVGFCLDISNALTFDLNMKTCEEIYEKYHSDYIVLRYAIMSYAIFGKIKGFLPKHLRIFFKKELYPLIRVGRISKDSFSRYKISFKLYEKLLPYIEEYEKQMKEKQENQNNEEKSENSGSSSNFVEELQNMLEELSFKPNNHKDGNSNSNSYVLLSNGLGNGMPISEETENFANALLDKLENNLEEMANEINNAYEELISKEKSNNETISTKSNMETLDDITTTEELLAGFDKETLNNELKILQETISLSNKKFKEEKKECNVSCEEEMSFFDNRKINLTNSYHKNAMVIPKVSCPINHNDISPEMKSMYEKIVKENHSLINNFVKTMKTLFNNRREKVYYGMRGKLAQEKLYKTKFSSRTYKKIIESEQPDDLAIVALIDCSGSCKGPRLHNAIIASVVLTEVCEKLNIPFAILAHNADYPSFYINFVKRFNGKFDKYGIVNMKAKHCNRDGLALLYAGEVLKQRPEKKKLLLSLSDGKPSDSGYSGNPAKEDMLRIGEKLKKEKINLVGVAISENKESNDEIQECYKESISVLNIQELTKTLLKFIKPLL